MVKNKESQMSGDMLVESFYEELDEKHCTVFFAGQPCERLKPDWPRGHQKINDLCNDMILNQKIDPDVMHLGDEGLGEIKDLPKVRKILHVYLEQIEQSYTSQRGCLVCIEFFPYRVWITGGQSWGDAPTDLYYPVEAMNRLSVLDAVGFNPVLPNYRKMIHTIIKNKELQPLLLHTDPDLDKLLEKEFKNDSHVHKNQVPGNSPRPPRKHKKAGKARP
jgi:hypothetical protein